MSKNTQSTLEELRLAIHGVTAPFSCEGTFVPDKPITLIFRDKSRFEVIRAKNSFEQTNTLAPLLKQCKPAPFGDGKKTRYDRGVRNALQLKAEGKGFSIENFDPESAGILKRDSAKTRPTRPEPRLGGALLLERLYGGRPLRTTQGYPRGDDMFGTLVVCLPSQFRSGELVLSHRGIVQKFDWGNAIEKQKDPNQIHWVAFFGDVDHRDRTNLERSTRHLNLSAATRRKRCADARSRWRGSRAAYSRGLAGLAGGQEFPSGGRNSRLPLLPSLPPGRAVSEQADGCLTDDPQPCSKDVIIWSRRQHLRPD